MVTRQDFLVFQGASWQYSFVFTDDIGDPVDLTGYSARMIVSRSFDQTSVLRLASDDGEIQLGADGVVTLSLSPEQTGSFSQVYLPTIMMEKPEVTDRRIVYIYDIYFTAPDGSVRRVLQGRFILHRKVPD